MYGASAPVVVGVAERRLQPEAEGLRVERHHDVAVGRDRVLDRRQRIAAVAEKLRVQQRLLRAERGAGEGHAGEAARGRRSIGCLERERHQRPRPLGSCHGVLLGLSGSESRFGVVLAAHAALACRAASAQITAAGALGVAHDFSADGRRFRRGRRSCSTPRRSSIGSARAASSTALTCSVRHFGVRRSRRTASAASRASPSPRQPSAYRGSIIETRTTICQRSCPDSAATFDRREARITRS